MSNPIVEALTRLADVLDMDSDFPGAWSARQSLIRSIPAVESLVAENARLTAEAPEFLMGASNEGVRTIAGALWHERREWRARALTAEAENVRLREQKDGAYSERNQTVIALAHMARMGGCRVGVREHEGEDWDDDWRAILFIDLPTGQASWHFHDSERPLLAAFPAYPDEWDGHTTNEKYDRLRALKGDD